MKKHIKLLTIGTLLLGGLTGCNDFLDREPLDKVIPEKYFASESDLAAYTINAYPFETVTDAYGINFFGKDNDTDNQASGDSPEFWIPGQKKVPSGEGDWDWKKIRACNYFFDNTLPKFEAGTITGNQDNVKHYIGEMYVIRAYNYYKLLVSLGDLPIITTALPDVEETLVESSKRQPRNKVARFILDDLQKATELLLDNSPGRKNRISKNVAHLLRARVALFEATWEKYHKGTAFVPGGKGWPGNPADVSGFNIDTEIAYFLDEAMKSSKVVGDYIVGKLAENTDTPEGMNASLASINPYYTMFCDENMEGYDEILMWKQFKEGLVTSNLQMELERNGGGSGWTRGMVNSFLMRNGLPIYADGSGYDRNWEKKCVNSTLQNRDSRIVIFTKKPGDANTEDEGDVNYYGNDGTPSYCSIRFIYGDKGSLATTGFIIKKGKHYSSHMANDHSAGTSGGIVFRAAEAMLIYMEASYEKNGRIDATADGYWKALRRRAKVDEDYNKTITATKMSEEAKGDFGAYSHGQLIDATLYNIRRERRNELCAEALRWEDLKRWRACDQLISKPYRVEGMLYWGSDYETQLQDLCKVDPAEGNMSSSDLSNYILPYEKITKNNLIAGQNGFLFTPAHYLNPIGMAVFRQTASDKNDFTSSVVYQNPGWKIEGDTGAQPVE
ncbi:RagB/SusD family nutrient uptake outer membrane protein [Bacteroides acidifaciens]|uniref:RagB/SusD family nutrient uptake outer membrane protein n=1 Tax=Bacteroides acidifaciens TaxID=85831 RepID=UPI002676CE06|nr:RagB/SusD family nutrient uptake outer membrane protein [Bacteroides acidifaciens]